MKRNILFLLVFVFSLQIAQSQNVGIGTNNPPYRLTVQTKTGNWGFMHTDSSTYVGSYIGGGAAEFGTRSPNPLYLIANNVDGPPAITIDKGGINVGLGTAYPAYNLDVHSTGNAQFNLVEGVGFKNALFSRYTNRLEIQSSDAFQVSIGGIDQRNLCIANNGYTGIGTSTPATKLQALTADGNYGITHTNGTITVGTYIGSGGGWFGTQTNHPLYFFTNNSSALMALGTNGYLGIGAITPVNKLQIGNAGGYSGNDIAFGNGTGVSGLVQTSTLMTWSSTTDMAFMPRGNTHGRVGINTTTPGYPLEVDDYVTDSYINGADYAYLKLGYSPVGGYSATTTTCSGCTADVSILAQANVMALEFDAASDARIKDISDVSNSLSDLNTLNKIEVTNYTLKDKIKNGNKPFKKVIAQQVETVYPQIVSRHTGFIPNVYQVTDKINKTNNGYILAFENGHHLSKNAKRIRLLAPGDNAMEQYNIVDILSEKEVLIDAPDLNGAKVFVYGEEVNDFRTVDYEGLTTLNISATQELSRLLKEQQELMKKLNEKVDALEKKLNRAENSKLLR